MDRKKEIDSCSVGRQGMSFLLCGSVRRGQLTDNGQL